jgi:hypothetical protein
MLAAAKRNRKEFNNTNHLSPTNMLIQAKYNMRPVHTWEDLPFCSEGRLGLVKSLCRRRYGV